LTLIAAISASVVGLTMTRHLTFINSYLL